MGLRFLVVVCAAVTLFGGLGAGCESSERTTDAGAQPPPVKNPMADSDCTAGSIVSAVLPGADPACQACVRDSCSTELTACDNDCECHKTEGSAVACLGLLTPGSTAETVATCVSGLGTSSNLPLMQVGTCLAACIGSCNTNPLLDGGGPIDAGGSADAPTGSAPEDAPAPNPDVAPGPKPDAPLESRPDVGAESKPEVAIEAAPQSKPEAPSSDAPTESSPEALTETRSDDTANEAMPAANPDGGGLDGGNSDLGVADGDANGAR